MYILICKSGSASHDGYKISVVINIHKTQPEAGQ